MLELPKRPYQRLSPPHWHAHTDKAFRDKLRRGEWKDHGRVRGLEKVIARRLDVPPEWVLATNSCTSALGVAFLLCEDEMCRPPGSLPRVRVCPLTYPATYCWAVNFGWEIEWVDCDEDGWPVGEVDVGVDLWGRAFPGSCCVLDAAHRVLDSRHSELLRGDNVRAVSYSFGPQKEVPCLEGGALVAPALEKRRETAEALIQSGQGNALAGGWKGYLSGPSAAAISKQISGHERAKQHRQNALAEYREWFGSALLTQPGEASGHLAVVRLQTPGHALAAKARLRKLHIDHSLHYPIPENIPCPNAKALVETLVSLPCHTEMRRHDVLLVARAVLTA
jgi:dTDP-4-amino-4,6-dideoxygalactose transaminase